MPSLGSKTDAHRNLSPGGYFEMQEMDLMTKSDDGTLRDDHALFKWLQLLGEAMVKLGRPFQDMMSLQEIMSQVGFVDIVVTSFKWPTNTWPRDQKHKELGAWNNENISIGLEGLTMAPLTRAHGWTQKEVLVFLADVRKDLNDKAIHAYWPMYALARSCFQHILTWEQIFNLCEEALGLTLHANPY